MLKKKSILNNSELTEFLRQLMFFNLWQHSWKPVYSSTPLPPPIKDGLKNNVLYDENSRK